MKKVVTLLTAAVLLLMTAAGLAEGEVKPTIVATTFPLYSLAQRIAGDQAEVIFSEDAAEGDILFSLTASENWGEKAKVIAADKIELIENDLDVLTVPVNCMVMASYLADALAAQDLAHNDAYQANLLELVTDLSNLDQQIREAAVPGTVISCNDGSMAYFAAEYGLTIGPDGILLSTFNHPSDEEAGLGYVELMKINAEKLKSQE